MEVCRAWLWRTCVIRGQQWEPVLSFCQVAGVKHKSSGLAATALTLWAFLPAVSLNTYVFRPFLKPIPCLFCFVYFSVFRKLDLPFKKESIYLTSSPYILFFLYSQILFVNSFRVSRVFVLILVMIRMCLKMIGDSPCLLTEATSGCPHIPLGTPWSMVLNVDSWHFRSGFS